MCLRVLIEFLAKCAFSVHLLSRQDEIFKKRYTHGSNIENARILQFIEQENTGMAPRISKDDIYAGITSGQYLFTNYFYQYKQISKHFVNSKVIITADNRLEGL